MVGCLCLYLHMCTYIQWPGSATEYVSGLGNMTSDYLYAVVVVTQAQERLNMAIRANG